MTGESPIRIFIVDDHPTVREGLIHRISSQPDMAVCGEADNVREAVASIQKAVPDVAIVDIALRGSDGLELVKILQTKFPDLRIVVHSMYDEATYAERCLHAGAKGYVNKEANPEEVISAIHEVMRDNIYLSRSMLSQIMSRKGTTSTSEVDPIESLTDRQLEIFRLIGEGKGSSYIAKTLHLSVHTIESHRENIKRKLGIAASSELTRTAVLWANQRQNF